MDRAVPARGRRVPAVDRAVLLVDRFAAVVVPVVVRFAASVVPAVSGDRRVRGRGTIEA